MRSICGGDTLCATLYARGCGESALFAGVAGRDAPYANVDWRLWRVGSVRWRWPIYVTLYSVRREG